MAESQPPKHHRNSIRLRQYDYASHGAYFVTICTALKRDLFGEIVDGQMRLNPLGQIVLEEWHRSSEIRTEIELDAFVVMPNHIHGIVWITRDSLDAPVGVHGRAPLRKSVAYRPPRSLGSFVAGLKSAATRRINESRGIPGVPVWQRNYFERVVRANELEGTRAYILENPLRWQLQQERAA